MNKVRYLTISRVAIELVEKLSDQENAQFNRIIFSCFQQLEDGQKITYPETDSPILNVALREATAELETGYKNYVQKINARKKTSADPESESADQRSISDQSAIDNRREEKRKDKNISEEIREEGMQGGRPFTDLEQLSINSALNHAYISPDPQFWSLAQKVGHRITIDSIRKAAELRSHSLSYVVKLMKDAAKGEIA